jgi:hypothetical protein
MDWRVSRDKEILLGEDRRWKGQTCIIRLGKGGKQAEIKCSVQVELSFALHCLASFAEEVKFELSRKPPLVALFELSDGAEYLKSDLAQNGEAEEADGE